MDQFALNFIVNTKLREYLNQRHYQNDMFESAASAAELYLMNRAAVRYLEKEIVSLGKRWSKMVTNPVI